MEIKLKKIRRHFGDDILTDGIIGQSRTITFNQP